MPRYEVYSTRWDDPRIIEELIPARGLEFSMPLSDHGEARFSATVEPGVSFWRASIAPVQSGILITRDNVPVWSGMVWSERQSGARTFDFECAEWGSFFERVPVAFPIVGGLVTPLTITDNDHAIFQQLVSDALAVDGQNVQILVPSTRGVATSTVTVNPWDDTTVEREFTNLSNSQGGPEWYFGTSGTQDNPTRVLTMGDRLGATLSPDSPVLEYVESTEPYQAPDAPPVMTLLGNLFPGQSPVAVLGQGGGNVIAPPMRTRDGAASATVVVATGDGQEAAQQRKSVQSDALLAAGWPRMTKRNGYSDVKDTTTLERHAQADLDAAAGLLTGFTLTTFDGEPDWTQVARGSSVWVSLDTDVYAMQRPLEFERRLLDLAVLVPDDGGNAQINWTVAAGVTL